jgi:hypothetical protein
MSFSTVQRDIELRLQANWATTTIDINPNVDFTQPEHDTAFIRLRVMNEPSRRVNIGQPACVRNFGMIAINIFVPLNTGNRTGLSYGDTLAELFREVQFNGITTRQPTVSDVGEYEGRYQVNMLVPFYWDSRF